jgi:hypothetical protein
MEKYGYRPLVDVLRLAAEFCERAADITAGYARRGEKEYQVKEKKDEQRKENKRKEDKVKAAETKIQKKEKQQEPEKKEKKNVVELPKKKRKEKEQKKNKSGYILFLQHQVKGLGANSEFSGGGLQEVRAMIQGQWKELPATEKEIWDEKALEEKEDKAGHELLPRKTMKSSEDEKKPSKRAKNGSGSDSSGSDDN